MNYRLLCKSLLLLIGLFAHPCLWAQESNTHAPVLAVDRARLDNLVLVDLGELPIIISAPHGGLQTIPGVEPRQGKGMSTGPSGFFTGRDGGTEELAKEIVRAITLRMGKRPYSVISSVDRKYLDPNRPAEIAYEDDDAKPAYDRYHASCAQFCQAIQRDYRAGLLLDIHGQGTSRTTVYRGTGNGKTVTRLRERFGDNAHGGDESLFGLLHKRGWVVFPVPFDGVEQPGFTGGFIVQTHGSHRADGIDAIQLEFGASYRTKDAREKTAQVLADAVAEYVALYIQTKKL